MIQSARCLDCGVISDIYFGQLNWPTCPNCGAGRTKLVKVLDNTVRL